MIYLVTNELRLFDSSDYKVISVKESLAMMESWKSVQFDTETDGKDPHINELLLAQFGSVDGVIQIVVDCTTVSIKLYKAFLESRLLIGQNLKFDLQFLYSKEIKPVNIYDLMVVEQYLHLGFPPGSIGYSLAAMADRYLGIYMDKTIRGQIRYRGVDTEVIKYGASDVMHMRAIMLKQIEILKERNAVRGAKIECDFVPVVAYLEWCGIKLDVIKWKAKMENDRANLKEAVGKLNEYCIKKPQLSRWVYQDSQGDLFNGYDLTPKFNIDWQKKEAIKVFQALGFDTKAISKATGDETDSVTEKLLSPQKGIDDEFLKLYFDYQGYYKVTTSFGQGHINAINPKTGRIHTVYRSIGTISGRMSSGSNQPNEDLAKLKGIPAKDCKYPK